MTVGTPILGNHHMANDKAEVMAYAKAAFWSIGDDLQTASVLYTDHGSPSKHFKMGLSENVVYPKIHGIIRILPIKTAI